MYAPYSQLSQFEESNLLESRRASAFRPKKEPPRRFEKKEEVKKKRKK